MALNLVRNSKVFFTTKLANKQVAASGFAAADTFELQVLDGFTFSQTTNNETVTINEAGATPTRGQRSFNTSLAPVDFSFTTYIRPYKSTNVLAEEQPLWNALFGTALTGSAGAAWTNGTSSSTISLANSNTHKLLAFGLIVIVDNVTYLIDNCALNQAVIDFGLDGIASVQWSGQATALRQAAANFTASGGTFGGGSSGSYTQKSTSAQFITNKLSTAAITKGGTTYTVPITGGSLTISNNISYLTPANLGVVNAPIDYFTGTRSITGTLNAYLKTGGSSDTGALLNSMLSDITNIEPKAQIQLSIGGSSSNTRVDINMPTTVMSVPTVDVQQVVSTALNFTAQGSSDGTASGSFDIGAVNEMTITYVTP